MERLRFGIESVLRCAAQSPGLTKLRIAKRSPREFSTGVSGQRQSLFGFNQTARNVAWESGFLMA